MSEGPHDPLDVREEPYDPTDSIPRREPADAGPPLVGDLITGICTSCHQPVVGTWAADEPNWPVVRQSHGQPGTWLGWVAVYTAADGTHRLPAPGAPLDTTSDCDHLVCVDGKAQALASSVTVLARATTRGVAQMRLWDAAVTEVLAEVVATGQRLGVGDNVTPVDVMDAVDRVALRWHAHAMRSGAGSTVAAEAASIVRQAVAHALSTDSLHLKSQGEG